MKRQLTLLESARFPTWPKVQRAVINAPRGTSAALATYLGITAPAVTEMLSRGGIPSYERVIAIIQFLQDRCSLVWHEDREDFSDSGTPDAATRIKRKPRKTKTRR